MSYGLDVGAVPFKASQMTTPITAANAAICSSTTRGDGPSSSDMPANVRHRTVAR